MIQGAKDVNPIMQLQQAYLGIEVAFSWKHNSLKFDQDVLAFLDGGNRLKSVSMSSKAWATEEEPRSSPSLNPKSCQPKPNSDPFVVSTGSTSDGKEWCSMSSRTRGEQPSILAFESRDRKSVV